MNIRKLAVTALLALSPAMASFAEVNIGDETSEVATGETRLRALVVINPSPSMEGNIYKFPLDKIGASYEVVTTTNFADVVSSLSSFDIMMFGLLANANDLTSYMAEIRTWVKEGGAIGIFDGCDGSVYGDFVRTFCSEESDSFVHPRGCYGWENTTSYGYVLDTDPPHPMRCFPRRVRFECRQWHCLKKSDDWTTVATCSGPGDKHPVTAIKRMGRGFVYVSSMQQRWSTVAENLRAFLMCCRLGLEPVAYKPPQIRPGKEQLCLKFKPFDGVTEVAATLTITDKDGNAKDVKKTFKPDAEKPGEIEVVLPATFKQRGDVNVKLDLKTSLGEQTVIDEKYVVPEAVVLKGPRYRNRLPQARRTEQVLIEVQAYPAGGRTKGDSVKVKIQNPMNTTIAKASAKFSEDLTDNRLFVPVELPLSTRLEASDKYKVVATVTSGDKEYTAETPFTVVGTEHPGEVTVDEDHTLVIDGKPFFPILIYHIKLPFYTNAVEMGFNSVQAFQWHSRQKESFNLAEEMGLKVFFENNEKSPNGFRYMPNFYKDCKSFLMWYLPDEPLHEVDTVLVNEVWKIVTQDVYHPSVTVDFNVPRFEANAARADILAPDRYIIRAGQPPESQPYTLIVQAINEAYKSVEHRKPIMSVIGAFGHETETDQMMTAFLSIVRDARGLMWYAWDENNGKTGVNYHEEAKSYLAACVKRVHQVEPYILDPVRRPFEVDNGGKKLYGMVCGTEKCAVIVVNPTDEAMEMPTVPEQGKAKLTNLFGQPDDPERANLIEPFSVRVETWTSAAKPKAKKSAKGDEKAKGGEKTKAKAKKSAKAKKAAKKPAAE